MSDGTTATASGMDTHKRWFLLDYEPTSVRVCVCVCVSHSVMFDSLQPHGL